VAAIDCCKHICCTTTTITIGRAVQHTSNIHTVHKYTSNIHAAAIAPDLIHITKHVDAVHVTNIHHHVAVSTVWVIFSILSVSTVEVELSILFVCITATPTADTFSFRHHCLHCIVEGKIHFFLRTCNGALPPRNTTVNAATATVTYTTTFIADTTTAAAAAASFATALGRRLP
jgi:hypothetical protein